MPADSSVKSRHAQEARIARRLLRLFPSLERYEAIELSELEPHTVGNWILSFPFGGYD